MSKLGMKKTNAIPVFHVHRPYFTIIMVTGLSRCCVQLKVLQSQHYVLNLSIFFTNFLPQLRHKHR